MVHTKGQAGFSEDMSQGPVPSIQTSFNWWNKSQGPCPCDFTEKQGAHMIGPESWKLYQSLQLVETGPRLDLKVPLTPEVFFSQNKTPF